MKPTVVSADALFEAQRETLKWQWLAGQSASERRFDESAVKLLDPARPGRPPQLHPSLITDCP